MSNTIRCAIKECVNEATIPCGIRRVVRKICAICYDKYFRGGNRIQLLKILNPQEQLGDNRFEYNDTGITNGHALTPHVSYTK